MVSLLMHPNDCNWYLYCRVRKNLRMNVGDLDVAAVACGLGRTIGNKVLILFIAVNDNLIYRNHINLYSFRLCYSKNYCDLPKLSK